MNKIKLTQTDMEVSLLSLGTMQFGTARSKEESCKQMELYMDNGGNFFDTAHVYGDWASDEKGCSEKVIGEWLHNNQKRSQVILSTKGCHPPLGHMLDSRVNVSNLRKDLEGSLHNLKTDYIDLYFFHRDNPQVPVAELLEALEEEVQKGKIRYYGCSNWSRKRMEEANNYAKAHGLKGFTCNQMMFTLADVVPETLIKPQLFILDDDYYTYHKESNISFMAYTSMAGGYFTKRLLDKNITESQNQRYGCKSNEAILNSLRKFVKEGYTVTDFLYAYIRNAAFPSISIASFHNEEQLKEGIKSIQCNVPKEMLEELIQSKELQKYNW